MAEKAPRPDWDALSDEQLDAMERRIAAKYMRKFPPALCFGVYEYGGVACSLAAGTYRNHTALAGVSHCPV